jgi:hypothetical protein
MSRDSGPEEAVCLGAWEPNEEVADAEDQGCLAAGRTACRCAEIAAGLGVRQSTLSEYLERAARDGLPLPKALTYATLGAMLFQPTGSATRQVQPQLDWPRSAAGGLW